MGGSRGFFVDGQADSLWQISGPAKVFSATANDHFQHRECFFGSPSARGQILDDGDQREEQGYDDRSNDEGQHHNHDWFEE